MTTLRSRLIRLAHANPGLRPHLLPMLMERTGASSLDKARGHTLTPKNLKVPPMRGQEKVKDPIAYVKYFSPYSGATWYVTEWDGKDEMFGWVDMDGGGELGYIHLPELENANRRGLPLVERDLYFKPTPLSKLK